PGTYEPTRPQPRFAGSVREVRGAIVRRLVAGPADLDDLVDATGVDDDGIDEAVDALIEDGLVVETEDGFALEG
ncbi:MAG TPA: A/G-specific adenine glycosylase, partial [Acidimicrobiia bacterium]|nr:A/G-specific adenine glycosylase [Acidimicrobiia bacterium]